MCIEDVEVRLSMTSVLDWYEFSVPKPCHLYPRRKSSLPVCWIETSSIPEPFWLLLRSEMFQCRCQGSKSWEADITIHLMWRNTFRFCRCGMSSRAVTFTIQDFLDGYHSIARPVCSQDQHKSWSTFQERDTILRSSRDLCVYIFSYEFCTLFNDALTNSDYSVKCAP